MRIQHLAMLAFFMFGQIVAHAQEPAVQEGVEPLSRGPVHEAFAQPASGRVEEPDIAPKEPPKPIEESPPDQKPAGDNVDWIPGYWDWDDDGEEYLWVSGFWRDVPPGRHWMPGHWQEVEDGFQWVHGFWADEDKDELEYVPTPPPSIDAGPSTPPPDENMIYVSGCWVYKDERYLWRPGYWVEHRPGWVWTPCHYVRSPGGCIHVGGYWDYPLHQRGLLFAPCRISPRLLGTRWTYSPNYVVSPDFLLGALFVRPANRCYYFGDYFEDRYDRRGFVPWVDYRLNRQVYDQNFAFYRHAFRNHDGWEDSLRKLYGGRRNGDVARPPRTLVQQNQAIKNITIDKSESKVVTKNINITNIENVTVLKPLKETRNLEANGLTRLGKGDPPKASPPPKAIKLEEVAKEQRERQKEIADRQREQSQQRQKIEQKLHLDGGVPQRPQPPPQPKPQPPEIKTPKLPTPKPPVAKPLAPPVAQPPRPIERPKPPPKPVMPKPEAKPLPKFEPPKPVNPPKPKPVRPKPKD